jgi:hypothetical protein
MIDPLTLAAIGAGMRSLVQLSSARAEARVLRARADLARAAAGLSPGTEIGATDRHGNTWVVRARSVPQLPGADDEQ